MHHAVLDHSLADQKDYNIAPRGYERVPIYRANPIFGNNRGFDVYGQYNVPSIRSWLDKNFIKNYAPNYFAMITGKF